MIYDNWLYQMKSNQSILTSPRKLKESFQAFTPTKSIMEKIIQTNFKDNDEEFRQLLIETKQIEIKILEQQQSYAETMNLHRRQRKKVEEVEKSLKKVEGECQKKREYLEQFYNYLQNKLKSGTKVNLFTKLEKLEEILTQKYKKEEKALSDSLIQIQAEFQQSQKDRDILQAKWREVKKEWQAVSNDRKRKSNLKEQMHHQYKTTKNQLSEENIFLQDNISKAGAEKKSLQNEEKLLKRLLNIEQQHKRQSQIIQNGIKKAFSIKIKEMMYKQAVNDQYQKNLPQLKQIIETKKAKKDKIKARISQKQKKLQKMKTDLNDRITEYSLLQGEVVSQNKKK